MTATAHALELVQAAARAASDKLAQQIIAFDVSEQLAITDAFVLASATNDRQVKSIVDEVEDKLREIGAKPIRREGELVRLTVALGPDSSATGETEHAWLHRMALRYGGSLVLEGGQVTPAGSTAIAERPLEETVTQTPWVTIVWDDPVNLMSYVTHVFVTYFNYGKSKAHKLMMQVHTEGRAVVASGTREEMEQHVNAMHAYGLWATLEKDE